MEELHIAQCGARGCEYEHTYISERIAKQQLMQHLRAKHNAAADIHHPSTDFFGWVFPLPERRGTTSRRWVGGGDATSV